MDTVALEDIIKNYLNENDISMRELARRADLSPQTISNILKGGKKTDVETYQKLARGMNMSAADLFGLELEGHAPIVAGDFVTFPIIGEVAAGYDHSAYTDDYGTVDVPTSWLHGRPQSDYFILKITGDSMYPTYQDGDLILVLRQTTLNYSGQVGVVSYEDDKATLKRVEFVYGEDWMRLVPINPNFPPQMVRDEQLEHCRVLGLPKMLIREITT